jgi:small-conductance mechanosensitive channel
MTNILERVSQLTLEAWQAAALWVNSPAFYGQLGAIGAAVSLAFLLAFLVKTRAPVFLKPPARGSFHKIRSSLFRLRAMVFPLLNITFLGIAIGIAEAIALQNWLIRAAQGLAVIFLLYTISSQYINHHLIRVLVAWVGIPVATLQVFGWLDDVTTYLDSISLTAGNIRVSLFALLRTAVFGALLFWLGRLSNSVGKQAIRNQKTLDAGTREVFAKLFEIALFVVIFLLLLQVMGINLTALAVFGGALGVGLGFGLQQIASNFISGIIILLDRSISIGDYIELEDGRSGTLRELNMRFGVIETFDGKDVVVPNEQFITSSYTNWSHKDPKQRYALEFQVAYSTDLDLLFENIRALCAEHPQVLSGEDLPIELRPDAEIAGFGDSGIDILVEFWMEGIDDGKNRVGADLLHSIWRSIQEHGMQIPFPQREVRILGEGYPVTPSGHNRGSKG